LGLSKTVIVASFLSSIYPFQFMIETLDYLHPSRIIINGISCPTKYNAFLQCEKIDNDTWHFKKIGGDTRGRGMNGRYTIDAIVGRSK